MYVLVLLIVAFLIALVLKIYAKLSKNNLELRLERNHDVCRQFWKLKVEARKVKKKW